MDKKIEVPAIHDKDLQQVLKDLGLLEELQEGKLCCINCSKHITWDNLFALKVIENKLVLFCDESGCVDNSTEKYYGRNNK